MDNVDGSGHFLDHPALIARFAGLTTDDKPTVTYCGSGTNACHNVLAMRLAGLPDPILYVGSYSDWSRSGMPTRAGQQRAGQQQMTDQPAKPLPIIRGEHTYLRPANAPTCPISCAG